MLRNLIQILLFLFVCKHWVLSLNIPSHHIQNVVALDGGISSNDSRCWGYEKDCSQDKRFGQSPRECFPSHIKSQFWDLVDFGYVKSVQQEMLDICESKFEGSSYLQCSKNLRFCRGRRIYFDFSRLFVNNGNRNRYREDLFEVGQVGGVCKLNKALLQGQNANKSPLQSWYGELQNFTDLQTFPKCDITLKGKVVFMKLDYGGNMYHHFCDFFNLYASQHVNGSQFDKDITIIMWDTQDTFYYDPFNSSWKVFTNHNVRPLLEFAGKRVCVEDEVLFPLLARMSRGLYYNSYVPGNCIGSNLFRAFSEHFLYRMDIMNLYPPITKIAPRKIRVTLLQRGSPQSKNVFRQIVNQEELVSILHEFQDFQVQVVEFDKNKMNFEKQLNVTQNSDIFIGMHGAGLAHFLFLPEWAVAVELYNCGDRNCYYDLARLRGVDYITWETIKNSPNPTPYDQGVHRRYGDRPKFWNWSFDKNHFRKLIILARKQLLISMERYQNQIKEISKDEL